MFSTTALIVASLATLVTGFVAGYLVGLFRWKNSPKKAEAESTALREGWQQAQARLEADIAELKKKLDAQTLSQPAEAQGDAPKKP